MLALLLTRHGLTEPTDVMLGGQLDVPLTAAGRAQAGALADRLRGVRVDRIIASPMLRALETAQVIATGRPVEVDERLRELDYGRWEGLTYPEIDARDPEYRMRWEADPAANRSPGGESGDEVAVRVRGFLDWLLAHEAPAGAGSASEARRASDPGGSPGSVPESQAEEEGERRVLVVAHGTLNRVLLCLALGVPIRDYRRRFTQDRTNLTVLGFEHGAQAHEARLILLNDVNHLRSRGEAPWG